MVKGMDGCVAWLLDKPKINFQVTDASKLGLNPTALLYWPVVKFTKEVNSLNFNGRSVKTWVNFKILLFH